MIYPIRRRGDYPQLETKSARVREFDATLKELVDDMLQSMYAAHGVGLAAPQIGFQLQVAVIDLSFGEDPNSMIVMVNPKIHHLSGEQFSEEGCLSIPGQKIIKQRFEKVIIRARTDRGKSFALTATGLLARAVQHEIDHLNGVLLEIPTISPQTQPSTPDIRTVTEEG